MKESVDAARSVLGRHVRLSLALMGIAVAVLVIFVPGSRAVQLGGLFELDGNALVDHGSGLPDDWSRVYDPATYGAGGYASKAFVGAGQEAPANDTTYWHGGGSKDVNDISQWGWSSTDVAPDTNEITDAYAAAYVVPQGQQDAGHTVLYFGADRYAVNGNSNIGFWFLQDPSFGVNGNGTFSGAHQNGDLFVSSAFTNGGGTPTINIYEWSNGSLVLLSSGTPCASDFIACAAGNGTSDVSVPWTYSPKKGSNGTVPTNGLFEGGIDLDALAAANNTDVPCFAAFVGETRSSQTTDAELKDLVTGELATCGSIELKKHWVGIPGTTTLKIGSSAGGSEVASKGVSGGDDTTGTQEVKAGTYYLSEDAAPLAAHYSSSLACENDATQPATAVSVGQGNSVTLNPLDQVVCTYTNTFVKITPTVSTTLKNAATNAVLANGGHLALGAGVYDTAQIGNDGGFPLSGTVTFNFFTSGDCTGTPAAQTGATVSGGGATSSSHLSLTAGNYSFDAQYVAGGDNAHNDSVVSACEPFVVDHGQLTLGTIIHNADHNSVTSVPLGSIVHDTAQVGGAVNGIAPTGAVSFTLFQNGSCTGNGSPIQSSGTSESNGDARTVDTSALTAGDYSFKAVVAGDSNYAGATGPCEPLTVRKAQLTLGTTIHDDAHSAVTSVPLGSVVHDTAQIGHAVDGIAPTGAVSFTLFQNGTCFGNGTPVQTSATSETNGDSRSIDTSALAAGDYSFTAVVADDANYVGATAPCEPLTVHKAQLSLATTIHDPTHAVVTGVPLGTSVHDTAQLGGAVHGFPAGIVSFTFFQNGSCTGQGAPIANAADEANGDQRTIATGPLAAGSYSFKATIAGSGDYVGATADCEPLTVAKADSSAVTAIHNAATDGVVTSVGLGGSVYDSATVSSANGSFKPSGTVSFTFYSSADCSTGAVASGSAPVSAVTGVASPSSTQGPLAAGSYSFRASYGGDANFNSSVADCEPLTVAKAQLAVTTAVHDAQHQDVTNATVVLGASVHDLAHVNGAVAGFAPVGGVTFVLYSLPNCQGVGQLVAAGGTENGDVRTVDSLALLPGTYGFVATAVGDGNYLGATGTCEPFTVAEAATTTTTAVRDASNNVVTTVPLGSIVHDSAAVTSTNKTGTPSGSVWFSFFTNGTCSGEGTPAGVVALDRNGVADPSSPEGPLAAGSYSFKASYAGDGSYAGSIADCEPFTVSKGTPATATTLHNASGGAAIDNGAHLPYGSSVYDTAALSAGSGFPFSGSVTFEFFANSACTGTPVSTQTGASISGAAAQSSTKSSLGAGNYAFDAKYVAGDDPNHNDSPVSACEPFTIDKTAPTIATTLSASEVVIGTTVHDSAKLTGASSDAGGTVTYSVFDNTSCSQNANTRDAGTVAVSNGSVADSNALLFNKAGDFYWQAAYSGDANNASAVSPCTSEHLVVDAPAIAITKLPAAQTVAPGATANFTITVTNTGTVTLTNVTVADPLSTGCVKTIGTLAPGQSSTYTCSQTGVTAAYTNVATATGHPPVGPDVTASASADVTLTPPPGGGGGGGSTIVDLAIVKTADPSSLVKGNNVTYTLTVTNNGPITDTGVQVADSLPSEVTFVSVTTSQGSCSGTSLVQCTIGSMTNGQVVTIKIVVNANATGTVTNTATVVGALPETTLANNTASATISVTAPAVAPAVAPKPPAFKPPVVKPAPKPKPKPKAKPKPKPAPPACYAVAVAPKNLTAGRSGRLSLQVTAKSKPIAGVKVELKGPGILKLSGRTDRAGRVTVMLHPKKAGLVQLKPAAYEGCSTVRIGVIGVFTPPPITG